MISGGASTSIAGGKFGFGRDYDGSGGTSETHIPYSATFAPNARKTIAFWLLVNSMPAGSDFVMDDCNTNSGATNFIRMTLTSGGSLSITMNGPTTQFAPTAKTGITTATWYHVAVTHGGNGGTMIFYVDGVATDAGVSITEAIGTNSMDLYIGRLQPAHGSTGLEPDMTIDDFAIFDRQLSGAEIATLALGSAAGPANLKTYNTNPVANIKTINTNPIANVKSLNTNT